MTRHAAGDHRSTRRGESAYYLSVNRNKLSVALDLDAPRDVALLVDLIREADAVIDNFRPGTLERRGVSIETLLTEQSELLWCTVTGFGANELSTRIRLRRASREWLDGNNG